MLILSIREKEIAMSAPIIRSSTDIRRDYNSIEALAKETGKPIYLTKNGRASLVVMDAAAFDYDRYVGLAIDEAVDHNKKHPKTYTLEEAKAEVHRLVAQRLGDDYEL